MDELSLHTQVKAIHRFMVAGIALLAVSLILIAVAALAPTKILASTDRDKGSNSIPSISSSEISAELLLTKVAGSRLIRPAQVQPAVKDSGAAQKLLARLKLQSVVSLGGKQTAYVRVKDESIQTVREGGYLLDFMVESVEPGHVRLSLEGVMVDLVY